MISNVWIERRKPLWERLQAVLDKCGDRGTSGLSAPELRDLTLLYRQVAVDLSIVRQDASGHHYARYLNQLLGRAHNIIYSGKKTSFSDIFDFFLRTWPRRVWELRPYLVISASLFLLCAIAGALLTLGNPDFSLQVLGPSMIDSIDRKEMWTHSIVAMKPVASSQIMTHNITVAFMTFAMGITAGLGTLYMIAFNGLLLGVVGAACGANGMSLSLWSFVAGHGSLEIPAILIAGGAGLRIGSGILFPGPMARSESIRIAGEEAIQLELGTIPLLIIAGIVEGFVSPLAVPVWTKFALGAALGAGLVTWVISGRPAAPLHVEALELPENSYHSSFLQRSQ